jgi:phosphoglycerol transferase MdoB-like AlkP superfamily enzyme
MTHLFILCQILLIASWLLNLPGGSTLSCLFLMSVTLYHLVDLFFFKKLHIRLRPSLFFFLLDPKSVTSSASKLGAFPYFGFSACILSAVTLLFIQIKSSLAQMNLLYLATLTLLAAFLCVAFREKRFLNPIFLAERDFFKWFLNLRHTNAPIVIPIFQEQAKFLSKDYPLLRSTKHFLGKKLFDLTLKPQEKPHIIFVVLESFRTENIGCLGAKLPLSPNFDRLAKKGILFSNFHSTGTLTCRCFQSSLFGVPPAHNTWRMNKYTQIPMHGLPQILSQHGYENALIQGGSVAFDQGIEFFQAQGFQTILGNKSINEEGSSWGIYDEHLMPFAASWLSTRSEPTFLNLYTITNHHPWIAPPTWAPPEAAIGHPYLSTFAYTDHALGLLIDSLREKGLLEKSILFIYGDHGQQLDLGNPYASFNQRLDGENVRVPLLIYAEGRIAQPNQIDTLSSQIDLLPTILDLFSLKDPHHSLGKSLLRKSSSPIYFSHPFDSDIQGCQDGKWKFLFSDATEELFNGSIKSENKLLATELRNQSESYWGTVNSLYETKSFAPPRKKESDVQVGPQVLRLDFSGSLRITDDFLEKILLSCPNLVKLNLSGCRLLTDRGLISAFTHCPLLEELWINELDDITGVGWPPAPHLSELRANSCHRFSEWQWLKTLISLRDFHVEAELVEDSHLQLMAETCHSLHTLSLRGLSLVKDSGLSSLFASNPYLKIISIRDCPGISDASLQHLKRQSTRLVQIGGCPLVSEEDIQSLSTLKTCIVQKVEF